MIPPTTLLLAALLLALPVMPVAAQVPPERQATDRLVDAAVGRGQRLFAYDRAAWISTDALFAKVPRDSLTGDGGYVVETPGDGILRVTYYRGSGAAARAFFVADIVRGEIVRQDLLAGPVPLTAGQALLANARRVAQDEAVRRGYRPCTAAPFNVVALPAAGSAVTVYLLSPQTSGTIFPMGGHYRIDVAADGGVAAARAFTGGCLDLAVPRTGDAGDRPEGIYVTHLLDPAPTEIHVFASFSLGLPIYVATRDRRVWQVRGTQISATDPPPG